MAGMATMMKDGNDFWGFGVQKPGWFVFLFGGRVHFVFSQGMVSIYRWNSKQSV